MAVLKSKKGLAKKAEENTTVQKKSGGETTTVKSGTPLDHTLKHDPKATGMTIGMSKGITKNMENYESLRLDVWLSDTVKPDETPEQALTRIESFIDQALEEALINTIGEE